MKRFVCLALVAAMALLGVGATAEAMWLDADAPVQADLDGDGAAETLAWTWAKGEYDDVLRLTVRYDGGEAVYDTAIRSSGAVWLGDLDGDGLPEALATGDEMSDDYLTVCLRYRGGRLREALFPDCARGESGDGYYKQGYGRLSAVDAASGAVTLSGSQDVLGTWFMSRTMALTEDGWFEFCDDGLWHMDAGWPDDETWRYAALVVKSPLRCTIGGARAVLAPGERLAITATDKASLVQFVTPDGREGELAISEDYNRSWGWLVDGVREEDAFETVPYAD